tara:strand:+ start:23565 stop:23732 length:168 start_codon:yes stop_codon:yes gene_type:complete
MSEIILNKAALKKISFYTLDYTKSIKAFIEKECKSKEKGTKSNTRNKKTTYISDL